jgi:hypothetical protein
MKTMPNKNYSFQIGNFLFLSKSGILSGSSNRIFPKTFFVMNNTNRNFTTVSFSFTKSDAVMVSLNAVMVVMTLLTLLLLFLLRKQKALKYRGISPYFSTIGIWMLIIRFTFWFYSAFQIQNPSGLTYKYNLL